MITHHEKFDSRTYPFSKEWVGKCMRLFDDDVTGLDVEIMDYCQYGNRQLQRAGQYIFSAARRIMSDNPYGKIKLFTIQVRYRNDDEPVFYIDKKCCGNSRKDMEYLGRWCFMVLAHEIGHYVTHRRLGVNCVAGPINEAKAEAYAMQFSNVADVMAKLAADEYVYDTGRLASRVYR